ncbi:hypothetical protein KC957_01190 [Candidatus Saccharibacteria bacterium]|nr:hypothetical protein [Candidatus Saccharibacteria bacterium]
MSEDTNVGAESVNGGDLNARLSEALDSMPADSFVPYEITDVDFMRQRWDAPELVGTTAREFDAEIPGTSINGVAVITWTSDGRSRVESTTTSPLRHSIILEGDILAEGEEAEEAEEETTVDAVTYEVHDDGSVVKVLTFNEGEDGDVYDDPVSFSTQDKEILDQLVGQMKTGAVKKRDPSTSQAGHPGNGVLEYYGPGAGEWFRLTES